jgi:hypothetical protein
MSYLKEKVAVPVYKTENTAVEIRHAPSLHRDLALTLPTSGRCLIKQHATSTCEEMEESLLRSLPRQRTHRSTPYRRYRMRPNIRLGAGGGKQGYLAHTGIELRFLDRRVRTLADIYKPS